jgi:hypothetical protein
MGMCVPKFKVVLFLAVLVCLCGCGPMDTILPSSGTYKIGANVNGMPLDELSFIDSTGKIQPYFEDPVSSDPDVTALVIFLRNSKGNTVNWKVTYALELKNNDKKDNPADVSSDDIDENAEEDLKDKLNEDELLSDDEDDLDENDLAEVVIEDSKAQEPFRDDYEMVISVKSLDGELPAFPLPKDLPVGRYTLVSQVMSGKNTLQRTEKSIYYMGNTVFSYDGINVHLPGITESSQVIPKGTVIMLETALNFDSRLNPYIIWYNGRKKIGEGSFSDGAGNMLWKAPDQSGFFSLRAEVFPVDNFDGLSGYQKEVSLLVSSKTVDLNLVSENIPQLVHWYTFEGSLNDSKMITSTERVLKPDAKNSPKWAGVSGTYGLVTGFKNTFLLPKVLLSSNETGTWQMLFRFKPVNEGEILRVQFDISGDIFLKLKTEGGSLVLELNSPMETVSQTYALPEQDSFITTEINFSILPEMLFANLNIIGDYIYEDEFDEELVSIEAGINDDFQILLGTKPESGSVPDTGKKPEITAIWDEFALYTMPPMEIISAEEKSPVNEEQPEDDELLAN